MSSNSPRDRMHGGIHYLGLKIQPMTYSLENGLNAAQHSAVKYVTRYRSGKGSPLENLRKAIHSIELLIEQEGLTEDCPEGFSEAEPSKPYSDTEDFVVDFSEELVEALYRRVDKIVEERLSNNSGEYLIAPHREKFLREMAEKKGGSDAF